MKSVIESFFENYDEGYAREYEEESVKVCELEIKKENIEFELKKAEEIIKNFKNEHGVVLFKKTGKVFIVKGNKGTVSPKVAVKKLKGAIFTHNHTYDYTVGRGFSRADINASIFNKLAEVRVVYKNGFSSALKLASDIENESDWLGIGFTSGNHDDTEEIKKLLEGYSEVKTI